MGSKDWLIPRLPAGLDWETIVDTLKNLNIETPSWGYADSGTRFNVFRQPGSAVSIYEKIDDAAQVQKYTGTASSMALHIPWDRTDDWSAVQKYAGEKGLRLGAVNPNLFQDDDYKLGSLTHSDQRIRNKAVDQIKECIDIMRTIGSNVLSLWLADGTNYPGQDSFIRRKRNLEQSLADVCAYMDEGMKVLIEYKFFEPAFYHTDIQDWGMAMNLSKKLGKKAYTLVDLGHHPGSANIEHIVAILLDECELGGFHFNNKKYADDDLTTGSINPYEMFLIFNEIVGYESAHGRVDIEYMIDQSHNLKHKIEAMIQSVVEIQELYVKALLVDREKLNEAQLEGDILLAEEILKSAFKTDVREFVMRFREEIGAAVDPLQGFRNSGYLDTINRERSSR